MLDRAQIVEVLSDLVRIESVNPELARGGSGELKIASYVADFLSAAGLKARIQKVGRRRANAVGVLRGRGGGRSLMLNGHLDTVGVVGMEDPFGARVEGDRLYGRGAEDMKGGIAAALVAAAAGASCGRILLCHSIASRSPDAPARLRRRKTPTKSQAT